MCPRALFRARAVGYSWAHKPALLCITFWRLPLWQCAKYVGGRHCFGMQVTSRQPGLKMSPRRGRIVVVGGTSGTTLRGQERVAAVPSDVPDLFATTRSGFLLFLTIVIFSTEQKMCLRTPPERSERRCPGWAVQRGVKNVCFVCFLLECFLFFLLFS